MKVVVVGASGNVGTAVLRAFRAAGGHELVGVSRRTPPPEPPYDEMTWHRIDVGDPAAAATLTPLLTGVDAVVNLAWLFQPARDRAYLRRVGVEGTRAVLAAAQAAQVPLLIQMSSVGAYSAAPRGRVVDESYPTDGVAGSPYSVDKASAERVLDAHEGTGQLPAVARLRPGLIMAKHAGNGLLRYGLPAWLPASVLDLAVLLPLDPTFSVPVVHARDVAAAVIAVAQRGRTGAFNLAAPTPLDAQVLAAALRARLVPLPWRALRAMVEVSWRLHLQRLDPGWIELAFSVPLLDTSRAAAELDWAPVMDAPGAIREALQGMRDQDGTASATLRKRSVIGEIGDLLRSGPISRRHLP